MSIDISHRQRNHNNPDRRVVINKQKNKNGLPFSMLSAAALVFVAVGLTGTAFSAKLGTVLYVILSMTGYAAVPLSAFLVAQVYNHARNPRKTVLALGILTLITHIPYILLNTGRFELLSQTSLMFPLFMGCTALMLSDMPNIEHNVKSVLILLICFIASVGDGGSAVTVWLIIFGSHYDRQTQTKLFYTIGIALVVLNIIFGIIGGQWYSFIPTLGFLIAVPFIKNFNPFRTEVSKGLIYIIFYPALVIVITLLKIVL